ncbi:uncharacterized protein G2W53_008775 [Senna tora]|uniref:Uncharacterized protein n=1 Tax=Senna tora TaxID=362788 RepID=A0A834WWR0_9FABA|nr:uncharacterized protein G2W53_008775 [Senna tora]
MEEKQLDFNQPFLSVRRFSSSQVVSETDNKRKTKDSSLVRLPPVTHYKSDLKSGPVSHPGTVPFMWEQTPGIPKDESKSLPTPASKQPLITTPNLPPGRVLKVKPQDSSDQVSKVVSVTQYVAASSLDKNVTKHESPNEAIMKQEKVSAGGSDDGDEAYQDALDTLSRTESFFMNCSVSGLSGLDDQELQQSESFSRDQQARNFMIGRFLPAAKAIACETPQYMSRKPPLVVQEQPRQVKEVVSRQRDSPHRQIVLSHYNQNIGTEESEDEDDDYNESENHATKVCGLFPRFCLLNPLPGLRMQDRVLSSAAHGRQARKEHARTAYGEKKSVDSQFGFKEARLKNSIDPHRRGFSKSSAFESTQCDFGCASPVVEKTLYVDSVHKSKSHSSPFSSAMEGQTNHRWGDVETLKIKSLKEAMLEDTKNLHIVDEKTTSQPSSNMHQRFLKPEEQGSHLDENSVRSSPKVTQCQKILLDYLVTNSQEKIDGPIQNHGSWRSSRLNSDVEVDLKGLLATRTIDQECSKVVSDGKIDSEGHCLKELALPSPKGPSESWLKRTLLTVSSRNICSRSSPAAAHVHTHSQTAKTALLDPKWETIVKSSKEMARKYVMVGDGFGDDDDDMVIPLQSSGGIFLLLTILT